MTQLGYGMGMQFDRVCGSPSASSAIRISCLKSVDVQVIVDSGVLNTLLVTHPSLWRCLVGPLAPGFQISCYFETDLRRAIHHADGWHLSIAINVPSGSHGRERIPHVSSVHEGGSTADTPRSRLKWFARPYSY
eukprot:scaffold181761_cov35-Tisochrysis_lutea.AAC.1